MEIGHKKGTKQKLFSARKPAGYCASENQEKFLGLDDKKDSGV